MTLDPDIRDLLAMIAAGPPMPKTWELSPAGARLSFIRTVAAFGGPKAAIGEVEEQTIAGPAGALRLRVYSPPGTDLRDRLPGAVFFHGGGWVIGDLDTHDVACRSLCRQSGVRIVAVDYRLAPEHPFPAAVEDCVAATAWVSSHADEFGIDPRRLAVAGDSAGANLAAVVAQMARDAGPGLAFQLLIYPATARDANSVSYRENARGYFLERETMDWFFAHYISNPAHAEDLRFAPALAPDLSGLPPSLVVTAGFDPLRDDGRNYASLLARAGNDVRLREYGGLVHGFLCMEGVSAACRSAVADCAHALRDALV